MGGRGPHRVLIVRCRPRAASEERSAPDDASERRRAIVSNTPALVTGATSGIGAAFVHALASRGHHLVLVARDAQRLESVAADVRSRYGVEVDVLRADLADRSQVDTVADRIADPDRPIDTLINNAGFGIHARLAGTDTSPHEHGVDVMIRAVLVLGAAAARSMRDRGRGRIINVSSTSGFVTMGGYSAIKAWATSYSESLAVELRGSGVNVTALCPGWVRTEFHERAGLSTSAIPRQLWLDADRVVEEGLRDNARGVVISIPSRRYKMLMWFARHLPRPL